MPVETVQRGRDADRLVARLLAIAEETGAVEFVVGLPLALSGRETASTADARTVAQQLADTGAAVRMVDERLTTVSAQGALHAAGRDIRGSRRVVDQVAAVILLQHALDVERTRGEAPGEVLVQHRKQTP